MRYVSLLAAGIVLAACNTPSASDSKKKQHDVASVTLTDANIYDKATVVEIVRQSEGKNKEADKLFLEGVDAYRNKKDLPGGAKLFKQSILLQPQARAYFELGNVLAEQNNLVDATAAYTVAEVLDYKPMYKVLYNLACVYSRAKDLESAEYYLVSAIEFGYSNVKNLYADKDLGYIRDDRKSAFTELVTGALSGATDPDKLQWNLFWHEFKPLNFPLVLDEKYTAKLGEDYISYTYERFVAEMRDNARFSREVGFEFYHVGLARNEDSIKTLIYAVQNVLISAHVSPEYYIASFDTYGKLIDKLLIGGHKKIADPLRVPTIQENGDIQIALFKETFEREPKEEGYDSEDNKRIETSVIGKEYYSIAADGHFIKKDALLGMNL
jgi:hypothetical protein